MKIVRLLILVACSTAHAVADEAPVFKNDFQNEETGKAASGCQIVAGDFRVVEEGESKFLELPGAPLDSFSVLFGPAQLEATASATFYGTKSGRKFPTFALGLNGGGGFRLQVSPAKNALEIIRGDLSKSSVLFEWKSGTWTHLKLQVHKTGDHWDVEGKAWAEGANEPHDWIIRFEDTATPSSGRATLWGSPYSGNAIRFDNLEVQVQAK